MVLPTVIGDTTKGDVDHPMREGQCRTLQVYPWWIHCRHVHQAMYAYLAGVHIHAHQQVPGTGDLSNRKDQSAYRVIDGVPVIPIRSIVPPQFSADRGT